MKSLPKPATIRKNFLFLISGNATRLLSQLCVLWLLHRYCSMDDVGWFFLGLAIASPIIRFSGLALMQVQGTDAPGRYKFGHYLGVRLLTNIAAVITIVAIAGSINMGRRAFIVISMVGLMKAVELLSNVIQGLFYRIEQMKFVAFYRMLQGLATICLFGSTIALTRSVILAVLAATLGYLAVVILYDLRISRRFTDIRPHFDWHMLWSLGRKAFPLAIVAGLNSLNTNLTRYVLVGYLDASAVGIFGTMAYMIVGLNQFCIALSHSAMPRLAKYDHEGDLRRFTRLLGILVFVGLTTGIVATVGTAFLGRWFLRLFKSELAEYSNVFIVVVAAGSLMFIGGVLGDVLVACQRFSLRAIATAIGVVISLVAALVMVSQWGIAGAGWSSLTSNTAFVLVLGAMVWQVVNQLRRHSAAKEKGRGDRTSPEESAGQPEDSEELI
jgi:O-antigen/teichoic acid export membrane protein